MFDKLQSVISKIESKGAEFVDARYDELLLRTITKENERIEECKTIKRAGVGFNVYYKGATGYAFSADLSSKVLEKTSNDALGIAKASSHDVKIKTEVEPLDPITNINLNPKIKEPAWLVDINDKFELLNRVESSAREYGENITSLRVMYGEVSGEKVFTNSEGTEIRWNPFILDLVCLVTSKNEQGDLVTGYDTRGGSVGLEFYRNKEMTPEDLGKNTALWAKEKIRAKASPVGKFTALCDNYLAGVLAHESFGHLTEGDFVISKMSPIHNKLGETLGSEYVSIIDEGVVPSDINLNGFWLPYDDQGVKTERSTLIEKGILKQFLHSRATAKILNSHPTGNARAVNFTFAPIPRMRNTYFAPGDLTEEEALEQLGTGIYAIHSLGGQVMGEGSFVFQAIRGYWVENGEKQYPLKDVTLSGNIFELLKYVRGATKDLQIYSSYYGGCRKRGGPLLPTGWGGPKLIIDNVRFGGEQ